MADSTITWKGSAGAQTNSTGLKTDYEDLLAKLEELSAEILRNPSGNHDVAERLKRFARDIRQDIDKKRVA